MGKFADRAEHRSRRSAYRERRTPRVSVAKRLAAVAQPAEPAEVDPASVAPLLEPFVPKPRRSGRAPPTGERHGPKLGISVGERRPALVQHRHDDRHVPWSADRFADLSMVASGIASDLDRTPPGRARDMLQTLLRIATGEWPRPTYYDKVAKRHLTSTVILAALSGMSRYFAYEDIEVVEVRERWLPQLIDAPGHPVRVVHGQPVPSRPVRAKVMFAIDKAERTGLQLPAAYNRGVSVIGFCEQHDLSYQEVRSDDGAVALITAASKRPGALGPKYQPLFRGPEYTADAERVVAWMEKQYKKRLPLPGFPGRPNKVDIEYIEAQVGLNGRSVAQAAIVAAHIKKHRAAFGVEARRLLAPPPGPTCADFKEEAKVWFAAEHGSAGLHNVMTALNRVFAARNLTGASSYPRTLFADPPSLLHEAAAVAPPLKAPRNLKRQIEILTNYSGRFVSAPADGLPASPAAALDFAINRWGGKIAVLDRLTGIPARLLSILRTGQKSLPQRFVRCLPALDEVLGTGDSLFRRFEPEASFRLCDCSNLYRSLEPKIRNLLPPGAHKLEDADLLAHAREVENNAIRQNRMYSKVLAASKQFWAAIPTLPDDAPFHDELRRLMRHKMMPVPDDAHRRPKGSWCKDTRDIYKRSLIKFARFALLAHERGGLGLAVEDVTLALFLNWRVLAAFMEFLSRRYEDIEHDGERRGALLTADDLSILQLASGLLHADYGWVLQRDDLFPQRVRVLDGSLGPFSGLEELRVRHSGDDELEAEEVDELLSPTSKLFRQTMPPELVEAANANWLKACLDARSRINNLRTYLLRFIDPSRNPFEPIEHILESDKPMNFLRDIAQAAQDDLPSFTIDPVGHAKAVRNLLMFVLLSVTALRSKNLRQLLYDPKGRGHITIKDDQLHIKIPWENFKNLGSWRLFGVDGFKFDYERLVSDWFNVQALFEHYVRKCRPLLIGHYAKAIKRDALLRNEPVLGLPTTSNALFPTASLTLMTEHDFGGIVRDLTRRYHVIDPHTGLVRPGYMFFGPHAVRDIVATHIVMSTSDPARWEEAADLLQTSIAMVQLRYTKRKVIDRLAKSDRHYDEATEGYRKLTFA